jgi:hypothetical protein
VNTVVRNSGGAFGGQLAAAVIVSSAHAGIPAVSGYVGALILCAAATCAIPTEVVGHSGALDA